MALPWCGVLVACAATREAEPLEVFSPAAPPSAQHAATNSGFALTTRSPQKDPEDGNADVRELGPLCGEHDGALAQVAARISAQQAQGDRPVDVDELTYALRAAGAPYVWPRAWTFEGGAGELGEAKVRMQRWLATFGDGGVRRCGLSVTKLDAKRIAVSAVAIDALADLNPLPTRVRVGQWLDVHATLLVPASAAKLIVLGPRGAPHAVVTSLEGQELRARFNADSPGTWLVQVLASVSGGPRPLLEALVFAGTEPPETFAVPKAPGEDAERPGVTPESALYEMINTSRTNEGLAPLAPNEALRRVAVAHAEAMRRARKTAHDAGDGDLTQRLGSVGVALYAGENVAHAGSAALAHRALWSSPSHRENLLFPKFGAVGVGVALDPDGTLWVCEVFAAPGPSTASD